MPVRVDLRPLDRFESAIRRGLAAGGGGATHIRRAFKQWAKIYRGAMQERFVRLSRGGGGRGGKWAKLKPSTIRGRKKGKGKTVVSGGRKRTIAQGTVAIMVNKGLVLSALDPVFRPGKGAKEEAIAGGVTVGYGGPARHEKGKGTIAMIAHTLHSGNPPHLPARPIIVEPDGRTTSRMAEVMEKALGDEWKQATR